MLGFQRLTKFLFPFKGKWSLDLLSGITTAMALLPSSISFAIMAGVDPLVGLYTTVIMCFITTVLGGRPGMISGATGAMAVVLTSLVIEYGIDYLFATIVLTGILQTLIGLLHMGKLIRILPKSVMVGFLNGLAIIIFLSQLKQFKVEVNGQTQWMMGYPLLLMVGLVLVSILIIVILPKFTKKIPSPLISIFVVTVLVYIFQLDVKLLSDIMSGSDLKGNFPGFQWLTVPFNLTTLKAIFPYVIILTVIGLSESLMVLSIVDEITHTRGRANKECIAQGVANIISGFFKGMGGCVTLGQTMINIKSGGRGRLSGFVCAIFLFLCIIVFWPVVQFIPIVALVGVMMVVVVQTFEWATFKFIHKVPKHDAFVIILVTVVTIFTNLAIAVITGVIIAALVFAWDMAKNIYSEKKIDSQGVLHYKVHGPLFFGSVAPFKTLFDIDKDPKEVIIDFKYSRVMDQSAIEAIQFIVDRYQGIDKNIHLRYLSQECKLLLGKAADMVEVNIIEDPDYHIASNKLD